MAVTGSDLWQMAVEVLGPWFRLVPEGEVRATDQGWLALSGEPVADLNLGYVDRGPAAAAQLQDFAEAIRSRDVPALVLLSPAVANDLAPTARALGLQPAGSMPLMVFEPAAGSIRPDPAGYRVEPATAADLPAIRQLVASAFSLPRTSVDQVLPPAVLDVPDLTLFLTLRAGEPVSTVAATCHGATIGLWNMATQPERQRQGAGRATLEAAIAYHRARGAQRFYLGATPAGKALYDRVGFQTLEETPIWMAGHSTQYTGH